MKTHHVYLLTNCFVGLLMSLYTLCLKKVVHQSISMTVSSLNGFSKFFYWHMLQNIYNKTAVKKSHHTLNASLHYLAKKECSKLACFVCTEPVLQ